VNIQGLLELIKIMPEYSQILRMLESDNARVDIIEEAKPYLIAALYKHLHRPMLVLVSKPEASRKQIEQFSIWNDMQNASRMPEPAGLPYQRINPDISSEIDKIQILSSMVNYKIKEELPIVFVSAHALMQNLPSFKLFTNADIVLKPNMSIPPFKLLANLHNLGYKQENLVEVPGQISHRGGIMDIFPPTSTLPVRLEYFGNTIESLRLFEPVNQRSIKPINIIHIGPAILTAPIFLTASRQEEQVIRAGSSYFLNGDNLLNYIPPETIIVMDNPDNIRKEMQFIESEACTILNEKLESNEVTQDLLKPYFNWEELYKEIIQHHIIEFTGWQNKDTAQTISLNFKQPDIYAGRIQEWIHTIKQLSKQRKVVIVISHQSSRLADMLNQEELMPALVEEIQAPPERGSITLVKGLLAYGWVMHEDFYLFTDNELFGFIKQQRQTKQRQVSRHNRFEDIKQGDFVVHIEHGIGKYIGVVTMNTSGFTHEYMLLQYAGGDRLYVPTDQIDRVERYLSAGNDSPGLNHLGSQEWIKNKSKARQAAEEIASDLLNLYAAREIQTGFAYSTDNAWQMELEASFPYVETPDQLSAIEQIKEDMSLPKPMDRLICGDVGYGKTEVALRAAFKAVMDGKQVALLVPTTVLAQQHYANFQERLGSFPLKLEMLSRFRSHTEQKQIVEDLALGKIDIIIGTHRLLQKDIVFKDLGLLIIDEEQRFGVTHKEFLKKMRREIDVITLSATPIPRTLHMSLAGVRDMSVIETPPDERLPIKTYVAEYDEHLIKEAIINEISRNGQVYFVHNRVQNIVLIANKLTQLLPEARIGICHGQMNEDQLELVMSDFAIGKLDVLVCTTIIESGLDVPNANTLIINQADRLGLTQLYQLRGRIGRGSNMAYAYLLYDQGKRLTSDAEKRLQTIYEATELGAGFNIAMKDLEIRGAGNILGVNQSGHINAIGFSLYNQLLSEAVEDLKKQRTNQGNQETIKLDRLPPPSIDMPLEAYIPENYIADTDTRLNIYKRLAISSNIEQLEVMRRDLKDRFGTLPDELSHLLFVIKIKILATKAGLGSISHEDGSIVLRKPSGLHFDLKKISFTHHSIKYSLNQIRLNIKEAGINWQEILEKLLSSFQ
jgi:transcription-repair coupling factor (superfamily II helicase)